MREHPARPPHSGMSNLEENEPMKITTKAKAAEAFFAAKRSGDWQAAVLNAVIAIVQSLHPAHPLGCWGLRTI